MRLSRLRLQLAAWFALVFFVGLAAADLALFAYLRGQANREAATLVRASADRLASAIVRELVETPGDLNTAGHEALAEWPADGMEFVVYDGAGRRIGTRAIASHLRVIPDLARLPDESRTFDLPLEADGDLRLARASLPGPPPFTVVAARSTATLREANDRLALLMGLSAPAVVALALLGGYVLARRALLPLRRMTDRITSMHSADGDGRLPVRAPADELDALAAQFNALLDRLAASQAQGRRFLAEVAHQIRTPLTVVRGESALGLDRARSEEEHREILRRIVRAAEQMTHRVDDLSLLAQAEAGDQPLLRDEVEVDGLVLDCVDMMRGRASSVGCKLELGTMDAAVLKGSEALVREAVTELLENACRYGEPSCPIQVSTLATDGVVRIEIASGGEPLALDDGAAREDGRRTLGLSIVRWIAATHRGVLRARHEAGRNIVALELPVIGTS